MTRSTRNFAHLWARVSLFFRIHTQNSQKYANGSIFFAGFGDIIFIKLIKFLLTTVCIKNFKFTLKLRVVSIFCHFYCFNGFIYIFCEYKWYIRNQHAKLHQKPLTYIKIFILKFLHFLHLCNKRKTYYT